VLKNVTNIFIKIWTQKNICDKILFVIKTKEENFMKQRLRKTISVLTIAMLVVILLSGSVLATNITKDTVTAVTTPKTDIKVLNAKKEASTVDAEGVYNYQFSVKGLELANILKEMKNNGSITSGNPYYSMINKVAGFTDEQAEKAHDVPLYLGIHIDSPVKNAERMELLVGNNKTLDYLGAGDGFTIPVRNKDGSYDLYIEVLFNNVGEWGYGTGTSLLNSTLTLNSYTNKDDETPVSSDKFKITVVNDTTAKEDNSSDKNTSVTLKDEKTKITAVANMESTAKLSVEELKKEDSDYKELLKKLDGYTMVSAYDVSIVGGEYTGNIKLTFTVDSKYNEAKAKVLHKKHDGTIETFDSTVKNGQVTIEVSELSPIVIGIADTKVEEETPTDNKEATTTTNPEIDRTPKMGDNNKVVAIGILATIILGIMIKIKVD